MDTEITYKYKDGLHPDIKEGHLTLDKAVYKMYTDSYGFDFVEDDLTSLKRRLWYCHFRASDDHRCKHFLKDIVTYTHDEELTKLYDWLLKQGEVVEIIFEMY